MNRDEGAAAIEAILFTMGGSVSIADLAAALSETEADVEDQLKVLKRRYADKKSGLQLLELDRSVQLCTKKELYEYLIRIAKAPKKVQLTDSLLETLAIIAYRQPITRLEVERIRGVNSDHAVNRLVEFGLVTELGRMDAPGRPLLFGTTEEFLRSFGVRSLDELPSLDTLKLEEFKQEAEEEADIKLEI